LHNNPVEEGFIFEPQEYKYSSAIDYASGKGFLDVVFGIKPQVADLWQRGGLFPRRSNSSRKLLIEPDGQFYSDTARTEERAQ
jgi:hypothetical protein